MIRDSSGVVIWVRKRVPDEQNVVRTAAGQGQPELGRDQLHLLRGLRLWVPQPADQHKGQYLIN